jgi:transcriptional regulator with GAF, ATPase, and Fis domain
MGFALSKRSPLANAQLHVERELYRVAIRASGGNVAAAARALGVTPEACHRRLRVLGLLATLKGARLP